MAKQIGVNCVEYFQFRCLTGRKVKKVQTRYETAIAETDDVNKKKTLTVCMHAEKQFEMSSEQDVLVFFYNEAIVQFGFVVLFSQVFTLAPLFSVFTNLLEIKIKLDGMGRYSRRMKSEGATGIGAWMGVMEVLSFIAIPVNIAIIVFTKKSRVVDQDGVETSKNSAWR